MIQRPNGFEDYFLLMPRIKEMIEVNNKRK